MKILIVNTLLGISAGGLRSGTLNLCSAIIKSGHEILLYSTDFDSENEFSDKLGHEFLFQGVPTIIFRAQLNLLGNIFSIDMLNALSKNIEKFDLVLIQSVYQITSTYAAFYCRRRGVPYILRPHGSFDPVLLNRRRGMLKKLYIALFEKRSFRHAIAIQYSSNEEVEMTVSVIKNLAPPLIVTEGICYQDFLQESINFDDSFYPELSGKKVILFLGRIHQKKGLELLIQAFSNLNSLNNQNRLVIVGVGEEGYSAKIRQLVKDLNIEHLTLFVGLVNEVDKMKFLHCASIFILPSYGENFGISAVEALASGLPTVLSNKVAISSKLADLQAALIVECNVNQITFALNQLLSDPQLSNKLSVLGPAVVAQFFSIEAMALTLSCALDKLFKREH